MMHELTKQQQIKWWWWLGGGGGAEGGQGLVVTFGWFLTSDTEALLLQ